MAEELVQKENIQIIRPLESLFRLVDPYKRYELHLNWSGTDMLVERFTRDTREGLRQSDRVDGEGSGKVSSGIQSSIVADKKLQGNIDYNNQT